MDEAPYSSFALLFWAATVGMFSSGFHAGGPVTAAVALRKSTVIRSRHRFSGRVSTQLTAPCTDFLHSRCVLTCMAPVRFVLADLRGRIFYASLTACPG